MGIAPLQGKAPENTGFCCLSQKDICSEPLQSAGWDRRFNTQRIVCGLTKRELEKPTRCSCSSSRGHAVRSSLPGTAGIAAPANLPAVTRAEKAQHSLKQLLQMDAGALGAKLYFVKQAAGETRELKIRVFPLLTVPERVLSMSESSVCSPKERRAAQPHLRPNTPDPNGRTDRSTRGQTLTF